MSIDTIKTTKELHDLGTIQSNWSGILSPLYGDDDVAKYIHAQFLEDASQYVERYQAVGYWTELLRASLGHLTNSHPETILDIGSGAGNTIFALLDLCPDALIVASDLSIPLLKALKDFYDLQYAGNRNCVIVQLNAEDLVFEENQFDMVVGGAILHHLYNPELTLAQCRKVLKPGGAAIFFEPFEIGYQLLSLAMKYVLQRNASYFTIPRLPKDAKRLFQVLVHDFEVRKGSDKQAEIFQHIDDKWLFTHKYLQSAASHAGFTEIEVYPIHSSDRQFSNQMNTFMKLGIQSTFDALPQWVRDVFTELDCQFSSDLLPDLIIEGCIILKK